MPKQIISFPHLGDYHIPIEYLLMHTTDSQIMTPLPITKKTLELGSKHSPDFVCLPFKYNLGNFIESLENGANVILQAGGGCRYGYYAEVQEQILKDLGYNFDFYSIAPNDTYQLKHIYHVFKKLNPNISFFKLIRHILITFQMIAYMDKIDEYIRENIGFQAITNSFEDLKKHMLEDFKQTKGMWHLHKLYRQYKKELKRLPLNKPENPLKVGIIGELYTAMEPASTYELEKTLAKMNIQVKRFTNVTYLLILKRFQTRRLLKKAKKYAKYTLGADGLDNVARAKFLAEHGYHGIIHTKPFGCTPEIGAIPIINKVCEDYHIPIIYLSFDSQTSETGIQTRLEAFYDMIKVRKEHI